MHYVYVLKFKNNTLYKGVTSDLRRRIAEHKRGGSISTKNRDFSFIYYECYICKSDALRREKFLKTTDGRRILSQQLKDTLSDDGSGGHPTPRPVE
jgi:putative endonuclease